LRPRNRPQLLVGDLALVDVPVSASTIGLLLQPFRPVVLAGVVLLAAAPVARHGVILPSLPVIGVLDGVVPDL
jgi:hypothetical protein